MITQIEPNISNNEIRLVEKYLKSGGWLTENKFTKEFEKSISLRVKRKYSVAVPNGTQAIYLSLIASGIGKNSRVAVPNATMIATINAIIWTGAIPIIVNVGENLCINIDDLKSLKKLDAVIYVPLNGRTTSGLETEAWCKQNNILLIEDSAHALGSNYNNKKACGKLGDVSIFSFTPHKIITTGQGGMLLTDNTKIYNNAIKLKTFNRQKDKSDWHAGFGLNFKITDIQSVIGIEQLKKLDNFIDLKIKNYKFLINKIENKIVKLKRFESNEVPWFYDIELPNIEITNQFVEYMKVNKIEVRQHYPFLSRQKYLKDIKKHRILTYKGLDLRTVWLPSSTKLSNNELKFVTDKINKFS